MRLVFLGTGTSHGIPVVGCSCPVCTSTDPRNKRTRASVWIEITKPSQELSLIIDTATEFRLQAVRERINHLDAVLLTHAHADHLHGLDDIRPLCRKKPIPVYGTEHTLQELRQRFSYIFHPKQEGGGLPRLELRTVEGYIPFQVEGIHVLPLPVKHGELDILGYRIGNLAYITDCSAIPSRTMEQLENLEVLVLDALRKKPHPTHFSISEALEVIQILRPKQAFFTHLCHDVEHNEIKKELPRGVAPSYDGLELDLEDPS